MKWSDTITFGQPLKDISRLTGVPVSDWDELLRQREEAAYARGRREGEAALNEQLISQRSEFAELQRGILSSLQNAVPEVISAAERVLIHLALESAQKIVAGLPLSGELVEAVVQEALRQAKDSAEVTVTLHPEDLGLLRQSQSSVLEGTSEIPSIRFIASQEVGRGGCLVQTRFGLIDARREVKVEQLSHALGI